MKQSVIPQEGLKLIACVTMLIDHIGAVLFPACAWLRVIGRLSFPIYCFLLAEGAAHTKHAGKYALRLLLCAIISEPVFDLTFYGRITFAHQNIMLSLVIGFGMIWLLNQHRDLWKRLAVVCVACGMAKFMHVSYGWRGIMVMLIFWMTRDIDLAWAFQLMGVGVMFWSMGSEKVIGIPLQMFGVAAILPIALYSGKKLTSSRIIQWAFYLFYPVHLLLLYLL